jgi:hypothetical protein
MQGSTIRQSMEAGRSVGGWPGGRGDDVGRGVRRAPHSPGWHPPPHRTLTNVDTALDAVTAPINPRHGYALALGSRHRPKRTPRRLERGPDGVLASVITILCLGQRHMLVPTGAGVREAQNKGIETIPS